MKAVKKLPDEDPVVCGVLDDDMDLDLDEETIGKASRGQGKGKGKAIPDDLRIFGPESAAWTLLGCMAIETTADKLKQAVQLRAKIVAGRHQALTPEDVALMRATINKPHPSSGAEGKSIVAVMIERDDSPRNRWGWSVLADYLEHRNDLVGKGEDSPFAYQDIVDRGAYDEDLPETATYALEAPPAHKLNVWGEDSPLYLIIKVKPPTKDTVKVGRIAVLQDAISRGDPGKFTRDDWKYFRDLLDQPPGESGITLPAQSDQLWDFLATRRMIDSNYTSARRREQLKPAKRRKN